MTIRRATPDDCLDLARLALIAGEGIPGYFWQKDRQTGQSLEAVGATKVASTQNNFSYRNAWVAAEGSRVCGMALAYRLPELDDGPLNDLPLFIRPLIELEREAPGSFYLNMLAAYADCRGKGIGSELMDSINRWAAEAGCRETSLIVFDQNEGALRLYRRLGYRTSATRKTTPHACHPYTGGATLLMTRPVV